MKRRSKRGPEKPSVPVDVTQPVVESLRQVLDYLWEDEQPAYYATPAAERDTHIFNALRELDRWLAKAEKKLYREDQ